jgi:hypothetical protein
VVTTASVSDSVEQPDSSSAVPQDLPPSILVPRFTPIPRSEDTWLGHVGFAHDLIGSVRPKLLVEVGTQSGESYFAFCQSILENGIDCVCYAIPPTTYPALPDELVSYNSTNYGLFSSLVTGTSDPIGLFTDQSIDLLHMTGQARSGEITALLRQWLPKLRRGGLLLLDGISVRDSSSETWRAWEELTKSHPQSFAFHHARGLGVVVINPDPSPTTLPGFLNQLFFSPPERGQSIRRYYTFYAAFLEVTLHRQAAPGALEAMAVELKAAQAERMVIAAEIRGAVTERNEARRDHYQLSHEFRTAKTRIAQLEAEVKHWIGMTDYERNIREQILDSLSWKITAPLRKGIAALRNMRAKK